MRINPIREWRSSQDNLNHRRRLSFFSHDSPCHGVFASLLSADLFLRRCCAISLQDAHLRSQEVCNIDNQHLPRLIQATMRSTSQPFTRFASTPFLAAPVVWIMSIEADHPIPAMLVQLLAIVA